MLRYHGKIGGPGNSGESGKTGTKTELADSSASGDVDKSIDRPEERHKENHELQPANPVTQAPDKGQQEQNDQNNAN